MDLGTEKMNRRDFFKAISIAVVVPTVLLKSKKAVLADKFRIVLVNQHSRPVLEAEFQADKLSVIWSVGTKQRLSSMQLYKENKLLYQQDVDVCMVPGDTITVNLPQEMYKKLIA
jgi:hypothetical protein